jgi:hypothetical protein
MAARRSDLVARRDIVLGCEFRWFFLIAFAAANG